MKKTTKSAGVGQETAAAAPLSSPVSTPVNIKKRKTIPKKKTTLHSAAAPAMAMVGIISPADTATLTQIFNRSKNPQQAHPQQVSLFLRNVEAVSRGF